MSLTRFHVGKRRNKSTSIKRYGEHLYRLLTEIYEGVKRLTIAFQGFSRIKVTQVRLCFNYCVYFF